MVSEPVYIAVVGAGNAPVEELDLAEAVGSGVAAAGATLVCGGLGGVMEAACRGARKGGGTTIGILPGDRRDEANPYVDVAIPTGMGEMRNVLVVRSADAVIAIGGEYGTLSEVAIALKIAIPVIGLDTWSFTAPGAPMRPDAVERVQDAASAVTAALAAITRRD